MKLLELRKKQREEQLLKMEQRSKSMRSKSMRSPSAYQTEGEEDFLAVYKPQENEKRKIDLYKEELDKKGVSTMQGNVNVDSEEEKRELGADKGWLTQKPSEQDEEEDSSSSSSSDEKIEPVKRKEA